MITKLARTFCLGLERPVAKGHLVYETHQTPTEAKGSLLPKV